MIGAAGILAALSGHASATGWFDQVVDFELKSAPGQGLTVEFWVSEIGPAPGRSGLAATSVRIEFHARIRIPMLTEPQSDIDPRLLLAVDGLMAAYSSDFDLDGTVTEVDLLGTYGEPLAAKAGYLNQDQQLYRMFDLTIPLIVNDLWGQTR